MVQAQVLAFLSILQAGREATREARVREEQKERKMAEMFYSKETGGGDWTPVTALYTVLKGLELRERSSSTHFFLYLK